MPEFDNDLFAILESASRLDPKPREEYVRAAFGWPGGKWRSLEHLLKHIPTTGKVFVDACGGSGVVTLNSPDWFTLKVFNDRHSGITAFYRCIRDNDKMQKLVDRLKLTLHSREEFIWCRDTWDSCHDDVERAARWYYMLRTSFGQLGRNWGRSTNGCYAQAQRLQNSFDIFPDIHERFAMVQVDNQDVLQCIRDYDSSETVFYIDPPYDGTDPGLYQHDVDHDELLRTIHQSKGWFGVSGYANKLYDSYNWDERHHWEVAVTIKAAAFTDENHKSDNYATRDRSVKAEEILWIRDFR